MGAGFVFLLTTPPRAYTRTRGGVVFFELPTRRRWPSLSMPDERGDDAGLAGDDGVGPYFGSLSVKTVRPGVESTLNSPAIRSASSCAIANPRPDP